LGRIAERENDVYSNGNASARWQDAIPGECPGAGVVHNCGRDDHGCAKDVVWQLIYKLYRRRLR